MKTNSTDLFFNVGIYLTTSILLYLFVAGISKLKQYFDKNSFQQLPDEKKNKIVLIATIIICIILFSCLIIFSIL